jgi:hypothetical protein
LILKIYTKYFNLSRAGGQVDRIKAHFKMIIGTVTVRNQLTEIRLSTVCNKLQNSILTCPPMSALLKDWPDILFKFKQIEFLAEE